MRDSLQEKLATAWLIILQPKLTSTLKGQLDLVSQQFVLASERFMNDVTQKNVADMTSSTVA